MTPRIALASCDTLPPAEVDDAILVSELESLGAVVSVPSWTDDRVDWGGFDACLLRTTWDYHQRHDEFVAWVDRVSECTRLLNPAPVVKWNCEKTYLRELAEAGLPVAPTIWLEAGVTADFAKLVEKEDWELGFLKPYVGAGAHATLPFRRDDAGLAAAQAHFDRWSPTCGFLLQPFIESVGSEGEYSVIFIDGEWTHTVRKVPVPGDYRVMDDFGAHDELAELTAEELALAGRVREACEAKFDHAPLLYARLDFLRDANGQLVINEAELVEPSLFFRHAPGAAKALARGLLARL